MTAQYPRKVKLLVGTNAGNALDLSQLKLRFEIHRGVIQTPNTCTVRIYNLSDNTVKTLQTTEYNQLLLQAGYDGNFGTIFQGGIKYKYRGHQDNINSYLELVAADGDEAYNFAVINTSLIAGSKPGDHLAAVANTMATFGVTQDQVQQLENDNGLPRGKVMFGMARDQMRIIADTNGVDWSIQDGKLQTILQTSYRPGATISLTSASGLIGFPQQTLNGLQVRALINPAIKIGTRIQLDNSKIQQYYVDPGLRGPIEQSLLDTMKLDDGAYKVLVAEHFGDTRGNEYYTDMICIGINGSIPVGSPLLSKLAVQPYGP